LNIHSDHGIVSLEIGRVYIVHPHNPAQLKHRGRKCVLLEIVSVSADRLQDKVAKVRFCDNNRIGRVELGELVLCEEIV
jgi:hypothetical protein